MTGSSPRVWGQASLLTVVSVPTGIIPTRMGTSYTTLCTPQVCRDHPHAYGDKVIKVYTVICYMGSSPRVWGQAVFRMFAFALTGIIPTRMGTRSYRMGKALND